MLLEIPEGFWAGRVDIYWTSLWSEDPFTLLCFCTKNGEEKFHFREGFYTDPYKGGSMWKDWNGRFSLRLCAKTEQCEGVARMHQKTRWRNVNGIWVIVLTYSIEVFVPVKIRPVRYKFAEVLYPSYEFSWIMKLS